MKRFNLVTAEEWAFRGFCLAAGSVLAALGALYEAIRWLAD